MRERRGYNAHRGGEEQMSLDEEILDGWKRRRVEDILGAAWKDVQEARISLERAEKDYAKLRENIKKGGPLLDGIILRTV